MNILTFALILVVFFALECQSFPSNDDKDASKTRGEESHKRRKNRESPHMEVLRVNGEGKALVVIVPGDKVNKKNHDIKMLNDKDPDFEIKRTEDGLKLVKDHQEFNIDTDSGHKKGELDLFINVV